MDELKAVIGGGLFALWLLGWVVRWGAESNSVKEELRIAYEVYRDAYRKAAVDADYPEGHEAALLQIIKDRVERETDIRYVQPRKE